MPTTLNRCPQEINICLTRGDTSSFGFTLLDEDGTAYDPTGSTFVLTVNTESEPTDATNQVFQLTGVLNSNVVSFAPDATQANQTPGVLFYDLQETESGGGIFTWAKGEIEWRQDIAK